MVGVINANASTPLSTQIGLARQADFQLLPGDPFPDEKQQASMASLAATATTATLTVTATAADSSETGEYSEYGQGDPKDEEYSHDTGLSTGAIAGIAVGAAIAGIAAAVLVFLLMRNRSLRKKVKQQEQQQQQPPPPAPMLQSPYLDSRHTSTLPPYHAAYTQVAQESKPPGFDRTGSPFQNQPGFAPYGVDGAHPRWTT